MKRLLISLVTLSLLLSCVVGSTLGEESKSVDFNDLASLSENDLLAYDKQIQEEKANRGLLTALPEGYYLVGRDIAPGYYVVRGFSYTKAEYDFQTGYGLILYIFADETKEEQIYMQRFDGDSKAQILLEEGQLFRVEEIQKNGAAYIEKSSALFME